MIRRFAYNKIFRTTGMLLLFLLLLLFPAAKEYSLEDNNTSVVNKTTYKREVYLLDKNNYISRCFVDINITDSNKGAEKLVELLINEGKYESKIPNGFKTIIPSDTKILSTKIVDDNVTVTLPAS